MGKVSVGEGRKRVNRGVRRPMAEWDVLLKDRHEGYISWSEFERNQQVITDNATGKGSAAVRGAVRRGELLLAGLLRCGHCGRKLYVGYGGKAGRYFRRSLLAWRTHGHQDQLNAHVVNYADDFVICCRPGNAEMAKTRMTALMTRLGLAR